MNIQKELRRERALKRFTIQNEIQWNNGLKGNRQTTGSYADYLTRKEEELKALKL